MFNFVSQKLNVERNSVVMDFSKHRLTIAEAKEIDMVDYLSALGYEPSKIRNKDYWYLSPLRDEKKPSFKINRHLNRWYDHGLGRGGNIIDFAVNYHQCTIGEFLRQITIDPSFHRRDISTFCKSELKDSRDSRIRIKSSRSLQSYSLLKYLEGRRISMPIAHQFCREVTYEIRGREYFGIGFKNDSGGYEIRNPYFKAGSSPKDITTHDNGADETAVFEGFFDFLSFKSLCPRISEKQFDFVILNSLSFFEKARAFMEKHEVVRLYLDRDKAGQNCSRYALSLNRQYRDESLLYEKYKDLNDWLVNFGKREEHAKSCRIRRNKRFKQA